MTFSHSEHHLLEWLSKEEQSSYGECKGRDLDRLMGLRLVRLCHRDARGRDFDQVQLTEEGHEEAKKLGEWVP